MPLRPPRPPAPARLALRGLGHALATALGVTALVACPGTLDRSRFTSGGVVCDVPERFVTSCAGGTCHSPGSGLVDLVSPGLADRLVGPSACMGAPLADPDDPTGSVLYRKLAGEPACGSKMPLGQPAFTADDLACVSAFIETLPPPMGGGGAGTGGVGGAAGGGAGGGGSGGGAGGG